MCVAVANTIINIATEGLAILIVFEPFFLYFQGNFAGLCPVTHNVFIIKPHGQYYIKIQGENQAILNIRSVNFEIKGYTNTKLKFSKGG